MNMVSVWRRIIRSLLAVTVLAVGCSGAERDRATPAGAPAQPQAVPPVSTPERYVEVPTAFPVLGDNPTFSGVGSTWSWTWRSGESISVAPGNAINIVGFSDAITAQIIASRVPVSKQAMLELTTTRQIRDGDEIRWARADRMARSIVGFSQGILIAVTLGQGPGLVRTEFSHPSASEVEDGTFEAVAVSGAIATIAGIVPRATTKVLVAGKEATLLFDPVLDLNWYLVDVPADNTKVVLEIFDLGGKPRRRSADFSSLIGEGT